MPHRPSLGILSVAVIGAAILIGLTRAPAQAGSPGHFAPAVPNILDFFVPDPGVYYLQYTPYYNTQAYRDSGGNSVNSITIHPKGGPGVTVNVSADVHVITLAPLFAWVTPWKILGARYAAFINPTISNTNLSAAIQGQELGINASVDQSNYAWGDMFIQPIWLGWSLKHWDLMFGEGFYAPVGKYSTTKVTVGATTVTVPSTSNVGLGYWTNQMQAGAAWYPFDNKGTSLSAVLTWELNSKQQDIDIVPGQHLVLNWGALQYLPVTKDQSRLISAGLTGYGNWQVTQDTGSESGNTKSQIQAIGGQVGFVIVPANFQINVRYLHEYTGRSSFVGDWVNVSFAIKAF